jgi:hypothetical protein
MHLLNLCTYWPFHHFQIPRTIGVYVSPSTEEFVVVAELGSSAKASFFQVGSLG